MEMVLPSECIDVKYLYEVINRINFREYITGSTIPHVYYKDYSLEIVPLPSLEEQKKIASFLSAIDEKISITQNQLDLTKQYKQGLLQQMFV
jgi:type I restriction enzyme S subunit